MRSSLDATALVDHHIESFAGNLAAADAQQQPAIDGLNERLVRIERCLELRDA